jgi:hypothetical protein
MTTHKIPMSLIVVCLVLPTAGAYGVRFIGKATTESHAMQNDENKPVASMLLSQEWDSNVLAVMNEKQTDLQSPFWFEEQVAEIFDNVIEYEQPQEQFSDPVIQNITVSSILPHPQRPMAIVNSKPARVGDEIDGGWKVAAINGAKRTVSFVHSSGKQITVKLANGR